MRPIYKAQVIQIEVTNVCFRKCSYCTRYCKHLRNDQKYFMGLDDIEFAIQSLESFPNYIGIMGGEPTLHPKFREICKIVKDKVSKSMLFTTGGKRFDKFKDLIRNTFDVVHYNPHSNDQLCRHQPITLSINEVVEDKEYRDSLINDCPFQKYWSPSISPKGGFFCEIACSLDRITFGPGGYPLEKRWWMKSQRKFQDQIDRYCGMCGAAIPIERDFLDSKKERITPRLFSLFEKLNLRNLNDFVLFNENLSIADIEKTKKDWDPLNFREDVHKFSPYKEKENNCLD